ncbi:MAG: flagellar assembly protein FliH [Pseudomonadales bacterium]|nr:flagellar assembly protein FliH [Pseudomonadales bacterium]
MDKTGRVRARDLENVTVKRWIAPTIEKGGHLVYAEPREETPRNNKPAQKLGAADLQDLEVLRQHAQEEGYQAGHQEGFKLGHQAGFEEGRVAGHEAGFAQGLEAGMSKGQEEGQRQATERLEAKLAELNLLLTHVTHALNDQDYQLEQALLNLVQEISRAVIERELSLDSGQLMKTVRAALAVLPPIRDNVKVIVNPADLPLLQEAAALGGENWRAAASADIARGGCRIESAQSLVDFTTESRFKSVMSQILSRELSLPAGDEAESDIELAAEPVVKPFAGEQ